MSRGGEDTLGTGKALFPPDLVDTVSCAKVLAQFYALFFSGAVGWDGK